MNLDDFKFLSTKEGKKALIDFSGFSIVEIDKEILKNKNKEERAELRAVASILELRKKAKGKFSKAEEMFFTSDGLEQSTGEKISKYIAGRFGSGKKIVDLTSSIGGNLVFLAKENKLIAVDKNEAHIFCARHNTGVYGVKKNVKFICADAYDYLDEDVDAYFVDPERARKGKTKTRSILNSEPGIKKIISKLMARKLSFGIKISPAFDYRELSEWIDDVEIEVISEDNVVKVVMLWFGKFKTCARQATCFIGDKKFSFKNRDGDFAVRLSKEPLEFIYEPNKAISKAHLVNEITDISNLFKLNSKISFLTGSEIKINKEIFRILKTLTWGHFSLRELKQVISKLGIERLNIVSRGFPMKPDEVYKKIKIKEGGEYFLILTTLSDDRKYYILGERV